MQFRLGECLKAQILIVRVKKSGGLMVLIYSLPLAPSEEAAAASGAAQALSLFSYANRGGLDV